MPKVLKVENNYELRMKRFIVAIIFILVFIAFSLMIFTGCRTAKDTSSVTMNDSVYVEKLVPVYIQNPADSSLLDAYFKCDSLGNVYIAQITDLKSKGIQTSLNFNKGNLIYKTNKPADSILTYTINKETKINNQLTTTITKTVTQMSSFEKVFFWIGLIGTVLLLVFLGIKIKGRIL